MRGYSLDSKTNMFRNDLIDVLTEIRDLLAEKGAPAPSLDDYHVGGPWYDFPWHDSKVKGKKQALEVLERGPDGSYEFTE